MQLVDWHKESINTQGRLAAQLLTLLYVPGGGATSRSHPWPSPPSCRWGSPSSGHWGQSSRGVHL